MYPIGELLFRKLKENNMRIVDAIRLAGYKNANSGIRAFNEMAKDAVINKFLLTNIHKAFNITKEEIDAALKATDEQLEAESTAAWEAERDRRHAAFRPHVFIKTERERPSQILFCAMYGYKKLEHIKLPDDIFTNDFNTQLSIVKETIMDYLIQTDGKEVMFFGKPTGFVYCRDFFEPPEERIAFDLNGDPLCSGSEHVPSPQFTVRLSKSKKEIPGSILPSPEQREEE